MASLGEQPFVTIAAVEITADGSHVDIDLSDAVGLQGGESWGLMGNVARFTNLLETSEGVFLAETAV